MSPKLDMIGLVAKDLDASQRFYRQLGMEIPERDGDEPYVETTLPGGIRVSWNDLEMIKGIDSHWVPPVGQRISMAFLCDSSAAVDAKHAELVAAGYPSKAAPWDAFWGQRYAQIEDPDGNVVDLFAPLA